MAYFIPSVASYRWNKLIYSSKMYGNQSTSESYSVNAK